MNVKAKMYYVIELTVNKWVKATGGQFWLNSLFFFTIPKLHIYLQTRGKFAIKKGSIVSIGRQLLLVSHQKIEKFRLKSFVFFSGSIKNWCNLWYSRGNSQNLCQIYSKMSTEEVGTEYRIICKDSAELASSVRNFEPILQSFEQSTICVVYSTGNHALDSISSGER